MPDSRLERHDCLRVRVLPKVRRVLAISECCTKREIQVGLSCVCLLLGCWQVNAQGPCVPAPPAPPLSSSSWRMNHFTAQLSLHTSSLARDHCVFLDRSHALDVRRNGVEITDQAHIEPLFVSSKAKCCRRSHEHLRTEQVRRSYFPNHVRATM
jgi:hypothetical protein